MAIVIEVSGFGLTMVPLIPEEPIEEYYGVPLSEVHEFEEKYGQNELTHDEYLALRAKFGE